MPRKSAPAEPASPYLNSKVEALPIAEIHTDLTYQRPINQGFVERVAETLDMRAFGVLLVALRDDDLMYVCDGQHRLEVGRKLGWPTIPAVLVASENAEDEARLFIGANCRSAMSAIDKYRAKYRANDPDAVALNIAVREADLEIGRRVNGDPTTLHHVAAVATLEKAYVKYGPAHVTRVLRILRETWHGDTYEGKWIMAVARALVACERCDIPDRDFVRRIGQKSVDEILKHAAKHAKVSPGPKDLALAMVWALNETRGKKIDPWMLDDLTATDYRETLVL